MAGAAVIMGVSLYLMRREAKAAVTPDDIAQGDSPMYRKAARIGAVVTLIGASASSTGDVQGKIMTEVQPMKMAAAEALYETSPQGVGAPFSVLTIGLLDGSDATPIIEIPGLLSFLATGTFDSEVRASTTSRRSTPSATARAATRGSPTGDGLRAQHPDDLLELPPDDRARRRRRS